MKQKKIDKMIVLFIFIENDCFIKGCASVGVIGGGR